MRKNQLRNIVILATSAIILLSFLGSFQLVQAEESSLQNVLNRGILKVGITDDYPPFESRNSTTDEIIGFDPDIIDIVASDLGVSLEFVIVSWELIFTGLINGSYDCIISAATITPDRELTMDFSRWYYRTVEEEYYGIACQQGAISLVNAFDSSLNILLGNNVSDPTISEIYNNIHNKWFGIDAIGYIDDLTNGTNPFYIGGFPFLSIIGIISVSITLIVWKSMKKL